MKEINIITTVGTSLLTNSLEHKDCNISPDYKDLCDEEKSKNFNLEDKYNSKEHEIDSIKNFIKNYFFKNTSKNEDNKWVVDNSIDINYECCAEIKTLKAIIKDNQDCKYNLYFLTTYTLTSKLCAELIKEFIENNEEYKDKIEVKEILTIEGLTVYDSYSFKEKGFKNLLDTLTNLDFMKNHIGLNLDKQIKQEIIFNISGGYKGLIPFLTIFSQVYDIEMNYIYEDSDSLIKIPKLPINYDLSYAEVWYPLLVKEAKDESGLFSYKDHNQIEKLEVLNLIEVNKNNKTYKLTILGDLFKLFLDKKDETSETVLGFIMENKIYEHHVSKIFSNEEQKYKFVSHSIDLNTIKEKTSEIDIILSTKLIDKKEFKEDSKKDFEFIAIELKPYTTILLEDRSSKLIDSLKRQLESLNSVNKLENLKEYHIYVYLFQNWEIDSIKSKLLEFKDKFIKNLNLFLKEDLKSNHIVNFDLKYFQQKLDSNLKNNPYLDFCKKNKIIIEELN